MRFFGDREREEDPRAVLDEIGARLALAAASPAGPRRHEALAASLVRAGELAQGVADAAAGDGPDCAAPAAMALATRLARAVWSSWRSGGRAIAPLPSPPPLAGASLPASIRTRRPEGHALYAVYPETYALAARALQRSGGVSVIGIRSIGTSLAAMVAAGAGARGVPVTVRPRGEPFARSLEPSAALSRWVARRRRGAFAVADEGPGLSGSSFAAVADALLAAGLPAERIHLFTSHPHAPGAHAAPRVAELLARLPRHFVSFEEAFLGDGPLSLASLLRDVLGDARIEGDLTGGRWRARLFRDERAWPPSTGWLERRKLLVRASGARFVARFAGLGAVGERKHDRARALAAAGVGVVPAALRHGFLVEPWLEGARPLTIAPFSRPRLVETVRRLVSTSAARPRPAADGATPAELAEMARDNAAEALGSGAGERARRLEELLPAVVEQARPVEIDGKMQAWEWLALADGGIVKTDAVDHHAGHELTGCQDALWDVAAAQLELGLSERETLRLAEVARRAGPGASPALLPFYRACYLALEVGRWSYAVAQEPAGAERTRREAALGRYRRGLGRALAALPRRGSGLRAESSSGEPAPTVRRSPSPSVGSPR